MTYETEITPTYLRLYILNLGRDSVSTGRIARISKVSAFIKSSPGVSAQGSVSIHGGVSGMSRIYKALNLASGDMIQYEIDSPNQITIVSVRKAGVTTAASTPPQSITPPPPTKDSVFVRQKLRPLHIELFTPENLNRWEPENEPDVYMAFGVLQEYTNYRYCCATSKSLLDRLGFTAGTKPDAILVAEDTGEYLIAEFKMKSSDFSKNHKSGDVDVLVVWEADETDSSKLPLAVLPLREISKTAAQELISG
jgi:hypothetical protein